MSNFSKFITLLILIIFTATSCGKKLGDARKTPTNALERARKNVEEGKGASIGGLLKKGGTNFEFSSSNPMWRASLETLDFLPLTTVDYYGGMIITDWYSDNSLNDFVKITVRFLSNEVAAENLKILVHKKTCTKQNTCKTLLLKNDRISQELLSTIIKKAVLLEKKDKTKK